MLRERTIDDDPFAVALQALAWLLGDGTRAERFLSLTGIAPTQLRERASDPEMLDAVLGFLEAYQPDLIACAEATGVLPERLVASRARLLA